MPVLAITLVLISACLHAGWNFLLKGAKNKLAFTALSLRAAALIYSPLFLYEITRTTVPAAGWACILGTGLAYFVYFVSLSHAYQHGDLSLVYPLTRGLGPALAFLGGILFLAEKPSPGGTLGVLLILAGIGVIHYKPRRHLRDLSPDLLHSRRSATVAAVVVGVTYGCYSIIDKIGVGRLHVSPPLYIYLTYTLAAILVGLWVRKKMGSAALQEEWKVNARACIAMGALNLFTYLLVLYAMSLPHTPVGYTVPLRTSSVLIGVVLGVRVLGEKDLLPKMGGALLILSGIVLIALKG